MNHRSLLPALAALALACVSPSPQPVYHTLTPLAPRGAAATAPVALEVLPVRLPELLQRSQLVLLQSPGTHVLAAGHRWGNPLEKDIQRLLIENLSALLGSDRVTDVQGAPLRLALDIQALDGAPGKELRLVAQWRLLGPTGILTTRRTDLTEPAPGEDYGAFIAAHDKVFERLSEEIAQAIRATQ